MYVKMRGDARTRRTPLIDADIETFGFVFFAQNRLAILDRIHHLIGRKFRCRVEVCDVRVRHDEQMPARVWIDVENDITELGTVNDEGTPVVFRITNRTEDARHIIT